MNFRSPFLKMSITTGKMGFVSLLKNTSRIEVIAVKINADTVLTPAQLRNRIESQYYLMTPAPKK